jgi:hypothetical protein
MDYYIKLTTLDKDKLLSEIEHISDKLFKCKPGSSVHQQLLQMYGEAQQMYEEKLFVERQGQQADTAMDIGEIDSVVITPDYSDEEIITITVDSYRDKI